MCGPRPVVAGQNVTHLSHLGRTVTAPDTPAFQACHGATSRPTVHPMPPLPKKKKKVDRAALASPFMRIPGMYVEAARDLLDLGFREIYELNGRAPEALAEELRRLRGTTAVPENRLPCFRLAVYYSENPEPERTLLTPDAWRD